MRDELVPGGHVDAVHVREPHGGAAEVNVTLFAPASRAICTISFEVVPRTIESSTISMFLPLNSLHIALSFCLTDFLRSACPGMMNVRPT